MKFSYTLFHKAPKMKGVVLALGPANKRRPYTKHNCIACLTLIYVISDEHSSKTLPNHGLTTDDSNGKIFL